MSEKEPMTVNFEITVDARAVKRDPIEWLPSIAVYFNGEFGYEDTYDEPYAQESDAFERAKEIAKWRMKLLTDSSNQIIEKLLSELGDGEK